MKRARILIIDDDPLFRNLIVEMLRGDFVVATAGEGSEGFYQSLERPPDAAVVDVQMPGWGLTTLKAFRDHPAFRNLKTVALTSNVNLETTSPAVHSLADDCVVKTALSRNELHGKLNRLLSSTPRRRQDSTPATPRVHVPMNVRDERPREKRRLAARQHSDAAAQFDESLLQQMIDRWD